jgi:hypothetical protein
MMLGRVDKNCWYLGWNTRKGWNGQSRTWVVHLSVGGPVWWRPNAGRKQYNGVTEWRAGWLLMAVQIASRPHG